MALGSLELLEIIQRVNLGSAAPYFTNAQMGKRRIPQIKYNLVCHYILESRGMVLETQTIIEPLYVCNY